MSSIDCHKDIKNYHSDEVVLSQIERRDMRERRDNGRIRLENGLTRSGHPWPTMTSSQGSYAMRTMVQDDEYDYDIDDGIYFELEDLVDNDGNNLEPRAARRRIKKALYDERLAYDAEVKNNCVRQKYPAGYHIDLPVYRIQRSTDMWGKEIIKYELASGDEWIESDARAVTAWFNEKVSQDINSGDTDYSQMRRVVRLIKKIARSRKAWKSKTTSGICITKLVVDHMVNNAGRDDDSLRSTMKAIKAALDITRQIRHPVLNKNLADWDDEKVEFFRTCLSDSLKHLEVLDTYDCTREKALKAWQQVFDTDYFDNQINEAQTASKSLLQPASVAAAGLTFPNKPIIPNKSSGFA